MTNNKASISVKLQTEEFKVLEISGKSGDQITSHKVNQDAMLYVIKGHATYLDQDGEIAIQEDEAFTISKEVFHELTFNDHSKLLLVIPSNTIMKFQKA